MKVTLEVPLQVGMIVSCVRRSGEFKIKHVWKANWVDGHFADIYSLQSVETGIHYSAFANDLYVPGELVRREKLTKYEVALQKQPQDEHAYVIIEGELDMLKYLVHIVLEDFMCLENGGVVEIKILKEVKDE